MLDNLVRAVSMLDYTVAIAKLSPPSLNIKSCIVPRYLWTYWGIYLLRAVFLLLTISAV